MDFSNAQLPELKPLAVSQGQLIKVQSPWKELSFYYFNPNYVLFNMGTEVQEETLTLEEVLAALKVNHRLILWNDDTNTFEHVINCLVKYLDYSEKQAEQIAWTVHNDGKCTILEGSYTEVEVYRKILKQEGLTVTVD